MTLAAPPSPVSPEPAAVVLRNVSWGLYEQLLAEVGDSNAVRLSYDGTALEIMSPSNLHESVKTISARLLETYSFLAGIPIEGAGSWTLKREDLRKGLEPDECYYVQSLPAIAGKKVLDLAIDPPPDLVIEVDISPHEVDRQAIYSALGVPEMWRYDGRRMTVLVRTSDGRYVEADRSPALPNLPIDDFNRFLQIGLASRQHAALQALRQWLNDHRPAQ